MGDAESKSRDLASDRGYRGERNDGGKTQGGASPAPTKRLQDLVAGVAEGAGGFAFF